MPTFEATRPDGSTHLFTADDLETAQRNAFDSSVRELTDDDIASMESEAEASATFEGAYPSNPDSDTGNAGSDDPTDDGEFRTISTPTISEDSNDA